ncbi:MAG TPA: CvpA family protein, partial [Phycisphaerae bacterium]|nr:CvpA family protein [Phycisphaerae bacterium]
MVVILNILALACTAAVMYMCAVHGVFRAGVTLAACVLAGAVAFGLFGPAAGLLGADNPRTVWYYAADALALWAIFCVVFLGLRVLAETLFKNEPAFPSLADSIGGAVLGLAAGYLAVGLCLVLVQMLPMPPSILGYSPFQYDGKNNRVTEGGRLWLRWDRGTLALFGWLSANSLGSKEHLLFNRYGELYPPPRDDSGETPATGKGTEAPRPAAKAHPDADDMLYYHWYRRWQYVQWKTGVAQGPLPGEPQEVVEKGAPGQLPGAALKRGHVFRSDDVTIRVVRIDRVDQVANFPNVRLGDQEIFLVLT